MVSALDSFEAPQGFKASEYKPPEWVVGEDHLTVEILEPTRVRVSNVMQIQRGARESISAPIDEALPLVVLNRGTAMDIKTVSLNGTPLGADALRITDTHVLVLPPQGLTTFALTTEVELDPQANKSAQGLFYSGDQGTLITQCEAESFRAITPFPDRPDIMPRWTLTLRAPEADYPVLLANGNLRDQSREASGVHTATYENPFPTASYLVALAGGKFKLIEDTYTTKSSREVKIKIYVEPGREDQCDIAMAALKRAMRWEEETWGVECDLDEYKILVVDEFNASAMENKGFNIFATPNVAVTEKAYSDPLVLNAIRILAHEHGHNLRGNRIGVRDWTQIALKEGFTTRTDQAFMESIGGAERRIAHVEQLRSSQFAQDAGAGAHAIIFEGYEGDPMESGKYNATTYNKAAEVIRMLEVILGQEGFRKGVDAYIAAFDGKAIVFEDLVNVMAKANARDLTQFKRWMHQVGTPEVETTHHYDATTGTLEITVTQACPKPPHDALHLPIEMGLVGPAGDPVALELEGVGVEEQPDVARGVLHLKAPQQTFRFKNVPAGTVPSLFRGFSAPVKLFDDLSTDERRHLMQHDPDGFNRFEASRNVVLEALEKMVVAHAAEPAKPLEVPEEVLNMFGEILGNPEKDLGISLKMLRLPDVNVVVQRLTTYDYETTHRALKILKKTIAERHKDKLEALYERYADTQRQSMTEGGEIRMDVFYKRGLRNLALSYLAELGESQTARARKQRETAQTMSDEEAAIDVLIQNPKCRDATLEEFFRKWEHDPVVLRKWIGFQTRVEVPDLIERLRRMVTTPGSFFNIESPSHLANLVLGLQLNLPYFHALHGAGDNVTCEGYGFIVDLALRTPNPYWAGRMVEDLFRGYPKMDSVRRGLMEKELRRLLAEPSVKPNVAERARKILGIETPEA